MKERDNNTVEPVNPARAKPEVVPVIDGAPRADQNAPGSAPAEERQEKNERQQTDGRAGRPYVTEVEKKYTFRSPGSNHVTSQGLPGRDRLNPRDGD